MTSDENDSRRVVFILRLDRDALGRVSGVVERVRNGEKARVASLAEVSAVLAAMLARGDGTPARDA